MCVFGLAIQYTNVGGMGMKGVWIKKFQRFKEKKCWLENKEVRRYRNCGKGQKLVLECKMGAVD